MPTSGSLDINLTPYSNIINNSNLLVANITTGISEQSDLIGTVIGIVIAVTLLVGLLVLVLGIIFVILRFVTQLKSGARNINK